VPPEPATSAPPLRVGRYEVISHLATGGMAQIYLAKQTGLGSFERHVVLKTIVRERASDQRFVTMFLDEAKLAATLNHQNVAQVYEVDQADGAYFMAMEYVHGENARAILETTIRRGWTIPLELALMIISGAAAGLHHAHERRGKNGQPLNIVHRDVSPANIMVGYDGSVKVLDFGIAKAEERATKTVGGTIKGKYGYMSPEQCKGKPIDRRSDIFALGIVLYELTTLRRAFKGNDDFETMKRIVEGDLMLPSAAVPGYPRELESIVLTAMANDAESRFQTAQELIEAIDAFAVREKLTGSNTGMSRYMAQLFGSKKEPWVARGGDSTDVVDPPPGEESSPDLEDAQTIVAGPRSAAMRVAAALGGADARPPTPAAVAGSDPEGWGSDATYVPPPRRSAQRSAVIMPENPAGALSGSPPAPLRRMTPPASRSAVMPVPVPGPGSGPRSTVMPVPGSGPRSAVMAAAMPEPVLRPMPELPASDEVSELGARPLVDDPKLGWETSLSDRSKPSEQPAGTRMPSEGEGTQRGTSAWWLVLALMLVLGVAVTVVIIALWT
jgi:eukaryotic-like serine/threonine-protein kinase